MSEEGRKVLEILKRMGETAARLLQEKSELSNMDWYRMQLDLDYLAGKAKRLNNAD